MPPLQTLHRDETLRIWMWDRVFVQRWDGPGSVAQTRRLLELHREATDRFAPLETVSIAVIRGAVIRPPDDEMREVMRGLAELIDERVAATATIVPAGGFASSLLRSLMSFMSLVARRRVPTLVTAHAAEAVAFVAERLPADSPGSDAAVLAEALKATLEE